MPERSTLRPCVSSSLRHDLVPVPRRRYPPLPPFSFSAFFGSFVPSFTGTRKRGEDLSPKRQEFSGNRGKVIRYPAYGSLSTAQTQPQHYPSSFVVSKVFFRTVTYPSVVFDRLGVPPHPFRPDRTSCEPRCLKTPKQFFVPSGVSTRRSGGFCREREE